MRWISLTESLRLLSHSRVSNDFECERKLYLSREWGGTGLIPVEVSWDLVFGNIVHKHLESLGKTGSIDYLGARNQILAEAQKIYKVAHPAPGYWAALGEGLLRAFVVGVWPHWMSEYEIEEAESWLEYEIAPGVIFRARRDLLLRSKIDSHLSYREFKTTSSHSPEWIASWSKSTQLHTGMYIERVKGGRVIRDGVVQGLYKGWKDKKIGANLSAINRGWVSRQYSLLPEYSYERKYKGWEMFSPFEEFPDMSGWVESMPIETLSEQLPRTAPIFPRDDIAQKYFKQQVYRQAEIAEADVLLQKSTSLSEIDDILSKYYRQNFSKCEPAWGYDCEFRYLCWQPWVEADPLASKLYVRYNPDHDIKVEI